MIVAGCRSPSLSPESSFSRIAKLHVLRWQQFTNCSIAQNELLENQHPIEIEGVRLSQSPTMQTDVQQHEQTNLLVTYPWQLPSQQQSQQKEKGSNNSNNSNSCSFPDMDCSMSERVRPLLDHRGIEAGDEACFRIPSLRSQGILSDQCSRAQVTSSELGTACCA